MRALLIPADPINRVVDVDPPVDGVSHSELRALLGAEVIASVPSTVPGVTLLIDGDGLLRGAGANHRVSNTLYGQALVGDILAVTATADGDVTDLTTEHRAAVMLLLDEAAGRAEMRSAVDMYETMGGVMAFFVYKADEGIYIRQTSTRRVSGLVTLAVAAALEEIARTMRAELAQALADGIEGL